MYMAAFKQSGVIATHSLREAFQVGELLASEDPDERTLAARSLGAIGASEASDALAEAMLDADDRVAIEARIALMRLEV